MVICLIASLRRLGPAGLLAIVVSTLVPAVAPADTVPDALRIRIEEGYRDRDPVAIEAVRQDLLARAADGGLAPSARVQAAYVAAYARFRQALAAEADRGAARGYLEDCIGELRELVHQAPDHAEARALLGSCYGMSTLYSVLATMTRGLEARRQMAEARRLAPDNPWVVMQDGLADWATPSLFGGDRALAIAKLERAAELFTAATAQGSRIAAWGAAEAFRQLGTRYRELGRGQAADEAFARADQLARDHVRVAVTASLQGG